MTRSCQFSVIAVAVLSTCLAQAAPLSVRVESRSGAPRILVNNKPVRARIFYGQPQAGLLPIKAKAQMVEYEFVASQTASEIATMHLRYGHLAGELYVDNIHVVDTGTGADAFPECTFEGGLTSFTNSWGVWPQAENNTVGQISVEPGVGQNGSAGLHIKINNPPNNNWPDFHMYYTGKMSIIEGHSYKVSFWVNSTTERDITNTFYRPGDSYTMLGGPPGHFESQVKLAASAGVDFVSTAIPLPWPKHGQPEDWLSVESVLNNAIKANPKVLLIPRIGVTAPNWWFEEHPDEQMKWESGSHPLTASPVSDLFKREASVRLQKLIEHLETSMGQHIAGYHLNGQNTGEWFYMDSWERPLNGYSECDKLSFRQWLTTKYKTDAALRKAWNQTDASLMSVEVPSAAARHSSPGGIFRDPRTERSVMDFVEFQQKSMADTVCDYSAVVRKATAGRKLVLVFYGYVFEFAPMSTGAGSSGHYALRQILNSPNIDIVCSPISYGDRGRGQSGPCMTTAESVTMAGKMWLNEDDTRTYLTKEENFPGAEHILTSAEQTNELLTRNVAQEATRNFATWWMDLPATGWYDDPALWARMKQLAPLDDYFVRNAIPYKPEIALVLDEKSMLMLSDGADKVAGPLVAEVRRELSRVGAPYGQYLLDDVVNGKVKAKMYVFAAAWRLDSKQRAALLKATKGSVCIWAYAPGYFDGLSPSIQSMKQLTGFAVKKIELPQSYAIPASKELKGSMFYVRPEKMSPTFAVTDAKQPEIQAKYPNGSVAVTVRKREGGVSVFWGTPGWNRLLLRKLAASAGIHLYAQQDCVVYANGDVLAVHSVKDGKVQIDTGRKDPVFDLLTGAKLGVGPKITLTMDYSQTRVLKIGPMK